MNTIAFPRLFDAVFNINTTAFTVFGFPIRWYGIILCGCFLLAYLYCTKRSKEFGVTEDNVTNVLLCIIPAVVIGARIYYVASRWDYYGANPGEIIKVWEGGIALYGGVIGGVTAGFIYSKCAKISFLSLADLAMLGLVMGQFIGRWANFVNAEAYGVATSLPWGMSINGGEPCHPTFLYESLWNFCLFCFLHFYSKRRRFRGEILIMYFGLYGLGRSWIEGLRTDSLYLGSTGIRISQLLAICFFVICTSLFIYLSVKKNYEKYELLKL